MPKRSLKKALSKSQPILRISEKSILFSFTPEQFYLFCLKCLNHLLHYLLSFIKSHAWDSAVESPTFQSQDVLEHIYSPSSSVKHFLEKMYANDLFFSFIDQLKIFYLMYLSQINYCPYYLLLYIFTSNFNTFTCKQY